MPRFDHTSTLLEPPILVLETYSPLGQHQGLLVDKQAQAHEPATSLLQRDQCSMHL